MKANFYGLKGKQISLFIMGLICTIILIRAWDKNPILTTFVQSPRDWWRVSSGAQISTDNQTSVNYEPSKLDEKDGSTEEQTTNGTEKSDVMMQQPTSPSTKIAKDADIPNRERETVAKENNPVKSPNTSLDDVPSTVNEVGADEERLDRAKKARVCNYAVGKWVLDGNETRPLYSGFGCKQWLSAMWACRLTQRMNFDYERLKWQPKNCQLEEFDSEQFLKRMRNKTIAFVGDSLGRQQFQSLMCMVSTGIGRLDVMDAGYEYGLVKSRGAIRPDGWAYRFPTTNTTILYYWSASLCDLEPLNPSNPLTHYAMHLDRPPLFLQQFLHKFDVLVLNTGHHWNRDKIEGNRWVMYLEGNPRTADVDLAKNITIHSIVKWVDSQLPKNPNLKAFYRSISPRHFVNGDWNTGGSCDNEAPMSIEKEVVQEESLDYSAWSAVRGTNVTLLEVTSLSKVRDEGHISHFSIKQTSVVQDCLHWCLPGVPDTWNEILAAQI